MDALGINLHDQDSRGRIEAFQWTLGQQLLKLGLVVIIEWGTWARSERDALRDVARALGAAVELHYVWAPADVLIERIRRRARESPPLQAAAIYEWFNAFEVPTEEELAFYDSPLDGEAGSRGWRDHDPRRLTP
jgi:predicted kinase